MRGEAARRACEEASLDAGPTAALDSVLRRHLALVTRGSSPACQLAPRHDAGVVMLQGRNGQRVGEVGPVLASVEVVASHCAHSFAVAYFSSNMTHPVATIMKRHPGNQGGEVEIDNLSLRIVF